LRRLAYHVVRVSTADVLSNVECVLDFISAAIPRQQFSGK
jgi:hypothetical protein